MKKITISLAYYNSEDYIQNHLDRWKQYNDLVRFQIIDDGSKIPITKTLQNFDLSSLDIRVFRIQEDILWNIPGVRNLGAIVCFTPWMLICDMDQTFERTEIEKICLLPNNGKGSYYRFNRLNGKFTMGTMLISLEDYWSVGGYDEDMVGNYGHNDPLFKKQLHSIGIKDVCCGTIMCNQHSADCELDRSTRNINEQKMKQKVKKLPRQSWDILRFKWSQVK